MSEIGLESKVIFFREVNAGPHGLYTEHTSKKM